MSALDLFGQEPTEPSKHFRVGYLVGEVEWYTPAKYLAAARGVLGGIDLDPASCTQAQERVRAERYFTTRDNGLLQPWHGRVWLNPPYRQPTLEQFIRKLIQGLDLGRVEAAILLVNNCTDASWFQAALSACDAICFSRGHIQFNRSDGFTGSPTQGQVFFYFGPEVDRFADRFSDIGFIAEPMATRDDMPLLWPRSAP